MHAAFLVYLLVLGAILAVGVKTRFLGWAPALVAIFLLVWADFILTAHLLSLFSAIHFTGVYVAASLALAAAMSAGLRFVPLESELTFPQFPNPFSPQISRYIAWFLASTAAFALFINLVMAFGMLPANPDSIVYRFPRAYWYFGHGSLAHFSNVADPRALYYPFNSTLLYLPLIHFQLIPQAFTLVSLLCWLVIALTSYLFARDFGGAPLFAAATAWLVCLTPNVLLQSLSTNDEIIAACALLVGLFFLHRWYWGGQTFDVLIGIVGVGVSAGSKLHIVFYWPLLLAIAIILAVHLRANAHEIRGWLTARRVAALGVTLALCVIIAFSFMIYNYASAGRVTAWEFNDQMLNKPFDWRVALQTVVLYAAQTILTPFADTHVALNWASRAHHYENFNRVFSPWFGWVDNGAAFTSASYRFGGINSSSAVVFNEHTIFIGFTWLAVIVAGIWLVTRRDEPRIVWPRFHLGSLLVWIGVYSASARYIEGFTVYLGYATIVATPATIFAFAPIKYRRLDRVRWVILAFVAVTHWFFALDIFMTSSPRNLIALMRASHWPASRGFSIDDTVLREIADSKGGLYNRSIAWGQPFWATMFANPQVRQFLAANPDPISVPPDAASDAASIALRYSRYVVMPKPDDGRLHLFIFPQTPLYSHAITIRIPDKPSPGFTWIGDIQFSLGPEWVFAAGNGVEKRFPGRDKYLLLPIQELSDFGRNAEPKIRIPPIVYGLGEADNLKFRFEVKIDGKVTASSDWQQAPSADLATPGLKPGNAVLTAFVRNDSAGGTIYSTDTFLQGTSPIQLSPPGK
jgi:hypothetical protein